MFGAGVVTTSVPLVLGVLKPAPLPVQEVAFELVQRSVTVSPGFTVGLAFDHAPPLTCASSVALAGTELVIVMVYGVQPDRALTLSTVRAWNEYVPAASQVRLALAPVPEFT